MVRYRIEVTEVSTETRDVQEWVKVRDVPLEEGGQTYGYVTSRKQVKDERKVFVGESATCPPLMKLTRLLTTLVPLEETAP